MPTSTRIQAILLPILSSTITTPLNKPRFLLYNLPGICGGRIMAWHFLLASPGCWWVQYYSSPHKNGWEPSKASHYCHHPCSFYSTAIGVTFRQPTRRILSSSCCGFPHLLYWEQPLFT